MPNYTEKYNLEKPLASERYNIEVHNKNMNKIEAALIGKVDISKVLTDVPADAKFTDTVTEVVDNLTTEEGGKALDARQGKILDEGKVSKTGDVMSGNLYTAQPETEGGWLRVFGVRNKDNSENLVQFGGHGVGNVFSYGFIGKEYNNANLQFYDDYTRAPKPMHELFASQSSASTQVEFDDMISQLHSTMSNYTTYKTRVNGGAGVLPLNGRSAILEGYKHDVNHGWQLMTSYYKDAMMHFRQREAGVWSDWYPIVTGKPIPWINATLENGWTGNLRYRLNSIGQLEINLAIISGITSGGTVIANIPPSHRVYRDTIIPLYVSPVGVMTDAELVVGGSSGNIFLRTKGSISSGNYYGSAVLPNIY